MKKNQYSPIILSIIVILFVFIYSQVGKATGNLSNLESEKEENEQQQSILNEQASDLEESKGTLEEMVAGLNSELSVINDKIKEIDESIANKESEIIKTNEEVEAAKESEKNQYEDMKKRIQFMFEMGDKSYFDILISGNNIAEILNQIEYVNELVSYDRDMMDKYKETKEERISKEQLLSKEQADLVNLREQSKQQSQLIASKINNTNERISVFASDISKAESEALEYERKIAKNQQDINDESRRIEESSILEAERIERESKEQASREQASRDEESRKHQNNSSTDETTKPYEKPNSTDNQYNPKKDDLDMLAALIECEAGDQSYYGMLCVGAVVMNRINSSRFPNTLYEVLYQPYQFTPVTVSGRFALVLARGANEECYKAAKEVLEQRNIVGSWLFFRMNDGSRDGEIIGDHVFY